MSINPKTLIETGIKLFSIDDPPPQLMIVSDNRNTNIDLYDDLTFMDLENINKKSAFLTLFFKSVVYFFIQVCANCMSTTDPRNRH